MRFGWNLSVRGAVEEAIAAERHGFDIVWIDDDDMSATALAASLAVVTNGLRIGITASVGLDHPIELAEEAAVADLALGGRLILGIRPVAGAEDAVAEVLDLLLECFASHPFRHRGERWAVPANLEQNVFNLEDLVRVAPAPAQLELPVWVVGVAGRRAAAERGLGIVTDAEEAPADLAAWWSETTVEHPHLVRRIRRSAIWEPPVERGRVVVDDAVDQLRHLQRAIGLDVVIVSHEREPSSDAVMSDVSRFVRPLVQLDRLPPGLEAHWSETHDREPSIHPSPPTSARSTT